MTVDLRRAADEEQAALQRESLALGEVRARQRKIADEEITRVTRTPGLSRDEQLARLDTLNAEADRLAAQERRLVSRVEALQSRATAARQAWANAESPVLLEAAQGVVGGMLEAVGRVTQAMDKYIAKRSEFQLVLRDSTTHSGSVLNTYPRPAMGSLVERLLRVYEDSRGVGHG